MRNEREKVREDPSAPRKCANEGCDRPAVANLCEACSLEWSLYHREERVAQPPSRAGSR
ncbi:MAG TPA: hypothetical protein VMR54_09890 [Thermoanaerobaculia bacterium]|nr:hypothetical protein [Thermoanaerobaculia bacterium]